jgi:amino acid adenylation domain-containing protein/thioester reductase-like protein
MTTTPVARQTLAVDPNGLRAEYPPEATTIHLIERQAREHPDVVAVTHHTGSLTYSELDGKANALAALLLESGAGRGDLLPMLVDGGAELPITLLAAMKAGIVFIPFDPAWPPERINRLVRELGATIAVASSTAGALPDAVRTVVFNAADLPIAARLDTDRPVREDLAYGFFTSGTTGTPKCTLNVHRGLLNRLTYMTRRFGERHVSLQNSRSTFDSSLWQLLWPLTTGGRVVMPHRDGPLDLERTVEQISGNGVTVTDFVPSIFAVLVDILAADPERAASISGLRHLLLGGEAINADAVRRFHELLPHVGITNTYGPTEASIGSVFHAVGGDDGEEIEIPLGRPIDNTSVVVVGAGLERLGPGETGELLIGGDCVGRGYLNDPERTSASFIANPFPDVPGDRLYRTGDLGRYREDGLLCFVGRRDDQIKIRGVRIEPAEVERGLLDLTGVRDVRVLVHGQDDHALLVAMVVAADDFDTHAARSQAKQLMPAELVPDRFVPIAAMPLNANGKADRSALVRLFEDIAGDTPEAEPLDGTERELQEIWSTVLAGRLVGPDESFFEIGGTSLSAHQLSIAIQRRFGGHFSVRDAVRAPTIRDQARLLAGGGVPGAQDGESTLAQMRADAQLPSWFPQTVSPAARVPGHVFLTGATGFVGCHLLDELLATTDVEVTCLVRGANDTDARERLDAQARRYGLATVAGSPRVTVLAGDLAAVRFGLSTAEFDRLAESIDAIVHVGAEVNLLQTYDRLRAANVLGTCEVLRLAVTDRVKALHHVSTLGILPRDRPSLDEGFIPPEGDVPADGYSQTKWVAETLVRCAAARGLPVGVYRLGDVMPSSRTGAASGTGSLAEYVLQSCVELGLCFSTGVVSDFTPVDDVCRFLAAAVTTGEASGCFHVVGTEPVRLDDIVDHVERVFELERVDFDQFVRTAAERSAQKQASRSVSSLLAILHDNSSFSAKLGNVYGGGFRERCCGLSARTNVRWEPPGRGTVDRYAQALARG